VAAIQETDGRLLIETDCLHAIINTEGYVSGVARESFVDKVTGAHELGFGLLIADFLMEPGWDDGWSEAQLAGQPYSRDPAVHGSLPKRYVELPQICTQARRLPYEIVRGPDFVAVKQWFNYQIATNGRRAGSRWEQTLVFPDAQRYIYACDRITSVNDVESLLFRQDVPGHLRHPPAARAPGADNFEQIYLSYHGYIPAAEFLTDFPPDGRFLYQRGRQPLPERMIRAYQVRLDGRPGPWLAGMTLDPAIVYEAWCHERGYVCFIQEIGGIPVKAGGGFSAAYLVGWFDSVGEMEHAYAARRGATQVTVTERGYTVE
jgi:hypothetical protein